MRAYLSTVWLILRRPRLFIDELQYRVPAKDVRRFGWINVWLATLIGTGMFAAAFAFHGSKWLEWMPAKGSLGVLPSEELGSFTGPAFLLWDQWFILIPAALSVFAGAWLSQRLLREVAAFGAGNALLRRRLRRMTYYFASTMVWEVGLLGIVGVASIIRYEGPGWSNHWQDSLLAVQLVAGGLVLLVVLWPGIYWLIRTSKPTWSWKWRYWAVMVAGGAVIKAGQDIDALRFGPAYYNNNDPLQAILDLGSDISGVLFGLILLGLLATVALWKWRWQALRVLYFLVIYPLGHAALFLLATAGIFWACGLVALAAASMLHR